MVTITEEEHNRLLADQTALNNIEKVLSRDDWGADEMQDICEIVMQARYVNLDASTELSLEEFSNPT